MNCPICGKELINDLRESYCPVADSKDHIFVLDRGEGGSRLYVFSGYQIMTAKLNAGRMTPLTSVYLWKDPNVFNPLWEEARYMEYQEIKDLIDGMIEAKKVLN